VNRIIPRKIIAGVTFETTARLGRYPAPAWSLLVAMRGPKAIDIESEPDGSVHRIRVEASDTAEWQPGQYTYVVRVVSDGTVHEIERGSVEIEPDVTQAEDGYDGRSHARRVLDAIEAVIEKRATKDQERYRINNRELYRTSIEDLLKLRAKYRAIVAREEGRGGWGRRLRVRL